MQTLLHVDEGDPISKQRKGGGGSFWEPGVKPGTHKNDMDQSGYLYYYYFFGKGTAGQLGLLKAMLPHLCSRELLRVLGIDFL